MLPKKPNRPLQCAECKHWDQSQPSEGRCRKHAPRPVTMDEESEYHRFEAYWPVTMRWDRCSEVEWNGKNMEQES